MRRRLLNFLIASCGSFWLLSQAVAADAPKAVGTGLSKADAASIARRFVATDIRMEAAVAEPVLRGDYWAFPLRIGYAGTAAKDPVLVHRFTGKVSWAGLAESGSPGVRDGAPAK